MYFKKYILIFLLSLKYGSSVLQNVLISIYGKLHIFYVISVDICLLFKYICNYTFVKMNLCFDMLYTCVLVNTSK